MAARVDNDLYKKVKHHDLPMADLVRKSLVQYFRELEPNQKLTNVYDRDLVGHLQNEIEYLRSQNQALMYASIPLLSRVKMKLLGQ